MALLVLSRDGCGVGIRSSLLKSGHVFVHFGLLPLFKPCHNGLMFGRATGGFKQWMTAMTDLNVVEKKKKRKHHDRLIWSMF